MKVKLSIKELRTIGLGTVLVNFIVQRVFCVHSKCFFPVHYTSRINGAKFIRIIDMEKSNNTLISFASSNGLYINASNGINISSNVLIASGVKIISANHDFADRRKQIKTKSVNIAENVWIGANAIILPGVSIGENSIIGASSVVVKDVPSNVVVVGNPSKIIKRINV